MAGEVAISQWKKKNHGLARVLLDGLQVSQFYLFFFLQDQTGLYAMEIYATSKRETAKLARKGRWKEGKKD